MTTRPGRKHDTAPADDVGVPTTGWGQAASHTHPRPAARRAPRRPERSGARARPSRHRELPGSRLDIREASAYTGATARAARGPVEARKASKTNFARVGKYAKRHNSAAPQPFLSKLAGKLDQKYISLLSKFGRDRGTGRLSFCEKSNLLFVSFWPVCVVSAEAIKRGATQEL